MKRSQKWYLDILRQLDEVEVRIKNLEQVEEWTEADGYLHDELHEEKKWLENQYWEAA